MTNRTANHIETAQKKMVRSRTWIVHNRHTPSTMLATDSTRAKIFEIRSSESHPAHLFPRRIDFVETGIGPVHCGQRSILSSIASPQLSQLLQTGDSTYSLIDTCQQGRAAIAMFGAAIAEFASKELAQPSNESYIHTI